MTRKRDEAADKGSSHESTPRDRGEEPTESGYPCAEAPAGADSMIGKVQTRQGRGGEERSPPGSTESNWGLGMKEGFAERSRKKQKGFYKH